MGFFRVLGGFIGGFSGFGGSFLSGCLNPILREMMAFNILGSPTMARRCVVQLGNRSNHERQRH
jgi:hypothetical protein